jgi:hypothetical protein
MSKAKRSSKTSSASVKPDSVPSSAVVSGDSPTPVSKTKRPAKAATSTKTATKNESETTAQAPSNELLPKVWSVLFEELPLLTRFRVSGGFYIKTGRKSAVNTETLYKIKDMALDNIVFAFSAGRAPTLPVTATKGSFEDLPLLAEFTAFGNPFFYVKTGRRSAVSTMTLVKEKKFYPTLNVSSAFFATPAELEPVPPTVQGKAGHPSEKPPAWLGADKPAAQRQWVGLTRGAD